MPIFLRPFVEAKNRPISNFCDSLLLVFVKFNGQSSENGQISTAVVLAQMGWNLAITVTLAIGSLQHTPWCQNPRTDLDETLVT